MRGKKTISEAAEVPAGYLKQSQNGWTKRRQNISMQKIGRTSIRHGEAT